MDDLEARRAAEQGQTHLVLRSGPVDEEMLRRWQLGGFGPEQAHVVEPTDVVVGVDPMEVRDKAERLVRALDSLLVSYRTESRPSHRELHEAEDARAAWAELGERMGIGS